MSLHELVIDSARRYPDRPAIVFGDDTLTYRELDRAAEEFAARLAAAGVSRGDRVVLWADKSPAVVAAMQGVLRLGAVYVPLDGTAPVGRVAVVAGDCGAAAVCTDAGRRPTADEVLAPTTAVLDLDGGEEREAAVAPRVDAAVAPDDPAYVLYTSGSTGTPKGVCLSHRNAAAFVDWAVAELGLGPGDRLANHAPFAFDLSVLDLYGAFAVGASVHLIPREWAYAPHRLVDLLCGGTLTVWYSVPSALLLMMRDGGLLTRPAPPALRAVCFAGEPFPVDGVRALREWTGARLLNLYGPTETNVCTFHEVTATDLERDRPVPIGRACSGDTVWAALPDSSVAGPGQEGELLVAGPTVMRGYWGHPPQQGPYHTGDIVRVRPDGGFDYVGRRDHTVKVRGHRIELGEVEAALGSHPEVDDVAVVSVGEGLDAHLVAFVVPKPDARPGTLALRAHLAATVPSYAVVDHVHLVPDLPRTANGKADRAAMRRAHTESRARRDTSASTRDKATADKEGRGR
ncbi:amino acid adenylation domain-containing protein [Saccharomonospora cyanea]|uniref:Amino acid adenylation enzyme/thioester reductase family protein n=1 Tax=Saccharomonospora cyanea NA-134 TaxID=882082 RepID=H5XI21_9PSEU|nr:amino acid adenylation domain-containing protein [Saccharomonospora cyanea]EHR60651.1 amino acid adenylation enzyme/thioester reductase family protein [Saccharomonospora cyanea NA-134]